MDHLLKYLDTYRGNYFSSVNVIKSIGLKSLRWTCVERYFKPPIRVTPLYQLALETGPYVHLAGISGASAVMLGAYGAHCKYPDDKQELREAYKYGNLYHLVHSVAFLGLPLTKRPYLSGTLMAIGTLLFCGACYYNAFTGSKKFNRLAPIGGMCLIFSWITIISVV